MPSSFDEISRIGENPFATPVEARDPARRLRGRMPAPVTVCTSQAADGTPVGITVSSVMLAVGEPPEVLALVDPLSGFWDATQETGRFVIHVLTSEQSRLAEKFALRFPGDPFEGEELRATPWGPALARVATRAACTLLESSDVGYSTLVRGRVDEILLDEGGVRPLVHYRGVYTSVGPSGT